MEQSEPLCTVGGIDLQVSYRCVVILKKIKAKTEQNKWAEDLHRHFCKMIYKCEQAYEKISNTVNHQRNAKQSHSEIPAHTR